MLYLVGTSIAVFLRRDSVYIQKRDYKPLLALAIVNVSTAGLQIANLAPIWGLKFERDCHISVFTLPMSIFTFVGVYMMRCISLFKIYYYNQTKARGSKLLDGMEKALLRNYIRRAGSQSSVGSDSLVLNVNKDSSTWRRAIGIPAGIALFGALFGLAYGGYKEVCPSVLPIVFTMVSLYALMTFIFFILLRKVKDPYWVKGEMLAGSVIFVVLILASGGQYASLGKNKNPTPAESALPGIHPLIIVIMSNTLSFLMPVLLSFRKIVSRSTDVKSILRNKVEWTEFVKICADYFVLENALFMQHYDKVKQTPTSDSIYKLYKEFIISGSPNEINISGTLRNKIKSSLDSPQIDLMALLDQVEKQVIKNLEENVMRYYVEKE